MLRPICLESNQSKTFPSFNPDCQEFKPQSGHSEISSIRLNKADQRNMQSIPDTCGLRSQGPINSSGLPNQGDNSRHSVFDPLESLSTPSKSEIRGESYEFVSSLQFQNSRSVGNRSFETEQINCSFCGQSSHDSQCPSEAEFLNILYDYQEQQPDQIMGKIEQCDLNYMTKESMQVTEATCMLKQTNQEHLPSTPSKNCAQQETSSAQQISEIGLFKELSHRKIVNPNQDTISPQNEYDSTSSQSKALSLSENQTNQRLHSKKEAYTGSKPKFKFNTRHENCGIQFMQSTKLLSNCNAHSSTVHDSYFMGNKPMLKQIGS